MVVNALPMSQQYIHSPLDGKSSIRVLLLQPAPNYDSSLHCTLTELPLSPPPEFSALSYSWDAQVLSCPISCGNGILLITPNCESALRQLRHDNEVCRLWIDSICIDQTSPTERSQQVALMGDIYKCATEVVVWLGKGDDRTELSMQRLYNIGKLGMESDPKQRQKFLEMIFGIGIRDESQDPIGAVFERSWFYRMWTVQEVTLPNIENVVVHCGKVNFPWIFLLLAVNYLKTAEYKWSNWDEATRLQKRIHGLLMDKRDPELQGIFTAGSDNVNQEKGLLQILTSAREKKATDPKDKIFALFGIIKEIGVDFPLPDYAKSLGKIYTEAAVACINHDKNLDVLLEAPSDNRRERLPSWVPDWSDVGWKSSDSRRGMFGKGFQAGCVARSQWSFSRDQLHLCVSGRLLVSIQQCGPPLELEGDIDSAFLRIGVGNSKLADLMADIRPSFCVLRDWVRISSSYDTYPLGGSVKSALCSTLLDGNRQTLNLSERFKSSFDAWHDMMIDPDSERFKMESDSFKALTSGPASEYHFAVLRQAVRKCFFVTDGGHFGIASSLVKQGDIIGIVAGLEAPVVLRRAGEIYCFVTPAYVHGLMNGEAWPDEAVTEDILLG